MFHALELLCSKICKYSAGDPSTMIVFSPPTKGTQFIKQGDIGGQILCDSVWSCKREGEPPNEVSGS